MTPYLSSAQHGFAFIISNTDIVVQHESDAQVLDASPFFPLGCGGTGSLGEAAGGVWRLTL